MIFGVIPWKGKRLAPDFRHSSERNNISLNNFKKNRNSEMNFHRRLNNNFSISYISVITVT